MELSRQTKIGDLIDSYPFLLDYLLGQSPAFSKLKNPLMRKTIAKLASVSKAAALGGLDPDDLLAGIATEIFKKTNDSVTLRNTGGRAVSAPGLTREERIDAFKNIVMRLHGGESVERLRHDFHELLMDVSPAEIGAMEQKLVAEGVPETEIRQLCDLHVELFTAESAGPELPPLPEGHPIRTYQAENALAEQKARALVEATGGIADELMFSAAQQGLKQRVADLSDIVRHYERKENQLFPIMEAHGLTAPPQVMWEIHDDIRGLTGQRRLLDWD
jgi:hypothetical protein